MGKGIDAALANDSTLAYQVEQTKQEDEIQEKTEDLHEGSTDTQAAPIASGKLIIGEEIAESDTPWIHRDQLRDADQIC